MSSDACLAGRVPTDLAQATRDSQQTLIFGPNPFSLHRCHPASDLNLPGLVLKQANACFTRPGAIMGDRNIIILRIWQA
jgi:hypothetical protein